VLPTSFQTSAIDQSSQQLGWHSSLVSRLPKGGWVETPFYNRFFVDTSLLAKYWSQMGKLASKLRGSDVTGAVRGEEFPMSAFDNFCFEFS